MKAKLFIIAFLITCLVCAFAFTGHSQAAVYGSHEGNVAKVTYSHGCIYGEDKFVVSTTDTLNIKSLIGDETWIIYSKTGAKIITFSESTFRDISLKFGNEFKRISILYKKDRNGSYKEYNIYLSKESASNIQEWAKINL